MDRSANMRAIKSKNMRPELAVRKLVHKLGYRFRLHKTNLPGKPDLVFSSRQKIIFVHGCFWHAHNCRVAHKPKSNTHYWSPKLLGNRERDKKNTAALKKSGWKVLVIWECEVKNHSLLLKKLTRFLG